MSIIGCGLCESTGEDEDGKPCILCNGRGSLNHRVWQPINQDRLHKKVPTKKACFDCLQHQEPAHAQR